jgi:predicted XRE-type DNA-binding protein
MPKTKTYSARSAKELARILDLPPEAAQEWEVQSGLVDELAAIVAKEGLTHAMVARRAKTSRTRITSILNRNLLHVSTDLIIRVIASLGYEVRFTVSRRKRAA